MIEAGLALKEALDQVPYREKSAWLASNFDRSAATAYRLMKLADFSHGEKSPPLLDAFLTVVPDDPFGDLTTTYDERQTGDEPPEDESSTDGVEVGQENGGANGDSGAVTICAVCAKKIRDGKPPREGCPDCSANLLNREPAKPKPEAPATTQPPPLCNACARKLRTEGPNAKLPGRCAECKAIREALKPKAETPAVVPAIGDADETVYEPILDADGKAVPEQARTAFQKAEEFVQIGKDVDGIVKRVKELSESPAGRCLHFEDVKVQIKNVKGAVLQSRPTHVCPYCNGSDPDCRCCRGCGWTLAHVHKMWLAETAK